ncbi:transporter particle component [Seiridium cupressi]
MGSVQQQSQFPDYGNFDNNESSTVSPQRNQLAALWPAEARELQPYPNVSQVNLQPRPLHPDPRLPSLTNANDTRECAKTQLIQPTRIPRSELLRQYTLTTPDGPISRPKGKEGAKDPKTQHLLFPYPSARFALNAPKPTRTNTTTINISNNNTTTTMSTFDQPLPPFNASDPSASFLNSSCLDFLLIEIVPMAYRLVSELDAADIASSDRAAAAASSTGKDGVAAVAGGTSSSTKKLDDEEERDAVFYRLETLGYRVGLGLVERFSRDRPRFNDTLDVIKFLCKDLWTLVFKKQIDNLKTNHRGVYVLTDNMFRPLSRMSTDAGGQAVVRAQPPGNPERLSDVFFSTPN